ncbi:hypothetical protein [Sinomonas terrae]|uniref:Uncharacterized protein n=1 Tax=Sinomonas terrae TaxID=2908838 RepID=A0ABS9U2R2_9MICC|nr:hypothetical protein [Sinomonas terrae]MCH6470792.1 hypothetical protein [Sinomonas terrae]
MTFFDFLNPRSTGRIERLSRQVARLNRMMGYDELTDPDFQDIIGEIRAGREIKAAELYCKRFGASIGESHAAVSDLRQRLR